MSIRRSTPGARLTGAAALVLASGLLAGGTAAQGVQAAFGENVADAGDLCGRSVAFLQDITGDGADEVLIGSPNDEDGGVDSGTIYVVSQPYYSTILYEFHGSAGDNCGTSVADVGDADGDGVHDFAVGLPGKDLNGSDTGAARVYSGANGLLIFSLLGPKAGSRFGETLAGGGDVNGDGYDDLIVGAPSWDAGALSTSNEGWAAVYSGKTGAQLKFFAGTGAGDTLGAAVAFVGDLNGDGRADYAIGSPGDDYLSSGPFPIKITDGGRADIYSGINHALLYLKQGGINDLLGSAIAAAGDTDADDVPEVLVGAPGDASGAGTAYLYEGPTGKLQHQFFGLGYGNPEGFGSALAPLGDVNKDGHDDVIIGGPMSTASVYGGYSEVFSGDGYAQYLGTLNGAYAGDLAGSALSATPGDVNGDGWSDVLTSWPFNDSEGADSGIAIVYNLLHFEPSLGFVGPGISELSMYGTGLYSGGQGDIRLRYAAGNSPAFLLASINQLFSGFKGGILVPAVSPSVLLPFTTDVNGKVVLPGIPGGNGYLIVYMQFLIQNASYAQGWGLSNALAVELLP